MARDGFSSMRKGTTKRLGVAVEVASDGCGDKTLKPAGSLHVLKMLTTMLATFLCLAVGVAHAHDSAFTGRLMDSTDAGVPKAHITVKNLATGVATARPSVRREPRKELRFTGTVQASASAGGIQRVQSPDMAGGLPSWVPSELGGSGRGPSTDITPQFGEIQRGVINQTNLPRQLQLALKLTW
jgi:hypothetical protein